MFTGIVESIGRIVSWQKTSSGASIEVASDLDTSSSKVGDSIAINGVCLTITKFAPGRLAFDVGSESLAVTTLGQKRLNDEVHLERATQLGARLDGHLVQGHIDGVGHVRSRQTIGNSVDLHISVPPKVAALCVTKGSVALDGVSLTLNSVRDDGLSVLLVPHTAAVTRLPTLAVGAAVNIETDIIGKYVAKLLGKTPDSKANASTLTWDTLRNNGFM